MRVVHIITGLSDGGAEGVLFRLCTHDSLDEHLVISLSDEGKYGPLLRAKGILVYPLHMRTNRPSLVAFVRLIRLLRMHKPDVIQTWMYHADLLGGIAARIAGVRNIVWGIRATTLEQGKSKNLTTRIVKLLSSLSWWLPKSIVVCAQRAMDAHTELGYDRKKMRFIPNGYDLTDFLSKPIEAVEFCKQLGIQDALPLLGTVGRYDPQKDHLNLLQALSKLKNRGLRFHVILVGSGIDLSNAELCRQVEKHELGDFVHLLGSRTDIAVVMSALDIYVLSSSAEAFPNVVCEAMACETPCVVTDVGDAAYIVGDTGWIVPPQDANALAAAIEKALNEKQHDRWMRRCVSARARINECFGIHKMVVNYHEIWNELR